MTPDPILLPGDIFLSRGDSIVSRGIRFCTRTIGEKRSRVNHVGFISCAGPVRQVDCIEALSTIVEHSLWSQYARAGQQVALYRVKKWTDTDRGECVNLARKYKGYRYGYPAIVTHWLDWVLQGAYVFRRLTNSATYSICSWLVDYVCDKLGVCFRLISRAPAGAASPDDIWDYIQAHPDEFEEILPLGRLI